MGPPCGNKIDHAKEVGAVGGGGGSGNKKQDARAISELSAGPSSDGCQR